MKKLTYILTLIFLANSFCYSQTTEEQFTMTVIEDAPEFPGGEKARLKYLKENFKYPQNAIDSGIQGIVFMSFFVERDGSISNIEVARGIGGGCDEEAIRLIEGMPNWIPGKQRGRPVGVQFMMPIRFPLDYKRSDKEENIVFVIAETMPEFPGGDKAFRKYLQDNSRYIVLPKKRSYPRNTTYLNFTIEIDGSVSNVEIRNVAGNAFDAKAIRAIEVMPNWIPGKQRGNPVRVRLSVPIKLQI
ncbi:MAG: energy transducer TonB [Bacteroidales bacterium]|jgi:TonB family protein|nr:energy transducer TonB [Bacteroidales bacterium]